MTKYDGSVHGITVRITLSYGGSSVELDAKIDTGADFCLIQREYGEQLGVDIESGDKREFRTVNSGVVAYGHDVKITAMDLDFDLKAYFYADLNIRRSVLGRQGWLVQAKLGIIDQDQLLYLSRYDD